MVNEPGGGSWLGGEAKRPTGTPAGVGDVTVPSPPVAANRVNTANARQSRVLTVVDEPGGAEAANRSPPVAADRVDTADTRQSRVNPQARARLVARAQHLAWLAHWPPVRRDAREWRWLVAAPRQARQRGIATGSEGAT